MWTRLPLFIIILNLDLVATTFYCHLEFYLDLELQVEHVEQVVTTFFIII